MNNPLVLTIITALGFSWPLIARTSGASPYATSLAVTVVSLFVLLAGVRFLHFGDLTTRGTLLISLSGVMAGVALLAYATLVSNPTWDISQYVPMSLILMITIGAVGGMFFYGEVVTFQKIFGLCLAIIGCWLITR